MLAKEHLLLILISVTSAQECGQPVIDPNKVKIINGEEVTPHSYPWMVSIQGQADPHYCGASVLSPNWVLTAGHCGVLVFTGTYFGDQVALGQHDRGRDNEEGRQV